MTNDRGMLEELLAFESATEDEQREQASVLPRETTICARCGRKLAEGEMYCANEVTQSGECEPQS